MKEPVFIGKDLGKQSSRSVVYMKGPRQTIQIIPVPPLPDEVMQQMREAVEARIRAMVDLSSMTFPPSAFSAADWPRRNTDIPSQQKKKTWTYSGVHPLDAWKNQEPQP